MICPGCGEPLLAAQMLGVWIKPTGERVSYWLCPTCTAAMQRDPQGMANKVELRLSESEGHA